MNSISETLSQNLISGFRATGIYSPNPNKVLKRIADRITPDDQGNIGISLDASLIDILREHRRINSEGKPKRKSGKKLNSLKIWR